MNTTYESKPFGHCVIDNFLQPEGCRVLMNDVQRMTQRLNRANSFFMGDKHQHNKFGFSDIKSMSGNLQAFFQIMTSKEFVQYLEQLTGIQGLIAEDVHLRGSGVHVIKNRGHLDLHTDFNTYHHKEHGKIDRRVNLLLYLNEDWDKCRGGDLLLVDNDDGAIKRIPPIFNRCVIFNTTNKSIHGHPETFRAPRLNVFRKSLAIYYYTKNTTGDRRHTTKWFALPKTTKK